MNEWFELHWTVTNFSQHFTQNATPLPTPVANLIYRLDTIFIYDSSVVL